MVGANKYANSKAVGMSFLERIWLKKFSTTSVKVATSLRKLLKPGLTSFRKSLNEHNDSLFCRAVDTVHGTPTTR